MIKAEVHSDDYVVQTYFDATCWFNAATDKEIVDLIRCEWRGDCPADVVALGSPNANMDLMLWYLRARAKANVVMGFECSVDEQQAEEWLKQHRPYLLGGGIAPLQKSKSI